MIGATLNCRGVGKKGMSVFLADFLRNQGIDFIGLQETIKTDYSPAFFRRFDHLNEFEWRWIPSSGRSGGILGGFRSSRFDICKTEVGRFYIKVTLLDKKIQMKWNLIIVYGAAQLDDKEDFLIELGSACSDQELPLLIGGDFNIIRFPSEKNKIMRRNRWNDMFNAIINCHGLRELYLSGGQYTWSNNQQDSTLEKLDRFLMNDAWETLFPLTTVHKLVREMSDHNPLILDTMEQKDKIVRDFKFEKACLQEEDFKSRVSRAWQKLLTVWEKYSRN
jgi:exonuclease III